MCLDHLERANRELLRAIEVPPDTGIEPRIDRIAASIWAARERPNCTPDPGTLYRLDRKLVTLQRRAATKRAERIERARECIRAYLRSTEVQV